MRHLKSAIAPTLMFAFTLNWTVSQAAADGQVFELGLCDEDATKGWSFYCAPPEPEPEEEPVEAAVPAPSPVPAKEPANEAKGPATVAMMAFRAHIDEVKYKAVLNPTRENVQAYMEVNKEIGQKAGAFTDQWQRILFSTPHLDANVEYPLAAAGVGVYQDQKKAAREATFKNVAQTAGILFIFEASEKCGICRVQGTILAQMEKSYGVTILAISKDGGSNEQFPNAIVDAGRLVELGLDEYPAPTLALVSPKTQEVAVIGSGLLTGDQVLERVHVITEVPVGERY